MNQTPTQIFREYKERFETVLKAYVETDELRDPYLAEALENEAAAYDTLSHLWKTICMTRKERRP